MTPRYQMHFSADAVDLAEDEAGNHGTVKRTWQYRKLIHPA